MKRLARLGMVEKTPGMGALDMNSGGWSGKGACWCLSSVQCTAAAYQAVPPLGACCPLTHAPAPPARPQRRMLWWTARARLCRAW